MNKAILIATSLAALAVGSAIPAAAARDAAATATAPDPAAKRDFGKWGIDLSAGDSSVKPGASFFDYANGAWLKKAEFPADQMGIGVTMDLYNMTQDQLRSLIDESARSPRTDTARKIGGLYSSFMDEARIEALDAKPLMASLAPVKAAASRGDMIRIMGESNRRFGSSIFGVGVIPDLKGPKVYTASLGIGGMGLPDRDFYLTEQFKPKRDAYLEYLKKTLKLIEWPNADAAAADILALETKIAESTWTRTERRDPNKSYHPMSVTELQAYAPDMDWKALFTAAGLPKLDRIIVGQDTAVPKVAKIFAETPLDTLKAWEAIRITGQASPYLSKRFVDNQFEFAKAMSGQAENLPRWKRGVRLVDGSLGEALGQEYVARYFPASSKKMMEELVANLHKAMRARIENATWMSPETRAVAFKKLATQRVKVGYPSKWRDYSGLAVDPADLYHSVERASAFENAYQLGRLGQPMDREEWGMTPQTLNAYFNPLANEIVFPAAFLQAPMFDPKADAAVNYGAIGAVIGHEITHSFDDTGRKFDDAGELRDWWQPADATRFTGEADRLAAQYSSYQGVPGMNVNGKLTLGENIGDQGGVRIALDAYHASLNGKKARVIDGLSGDQRFFLAWAQGWRSKYRPDIEKMVLVSDVHSPARWRVDGTLRNIDEWYAAFDVKPGDALYLKPEDRVRVW